MELHIAETPNKTNLLESRDGNLWPSHVDISHHPAHSACEVCEDLRAMGNDFVSMFERLFCDTSARRLLPLCTSDVIERCFDVDALTMKSGRLDSRAAVASLNVPFKAYNTSDLWNV